MIPARGAAALALALAIGLAPFQAAEISAAARREASQCRAGEKIVYSCRFGGRIGSVCLGGGSIHYRFGPPGHPEIEIASEPDWSNVHLNSLYGGGLIQRHVRFTRDDHHYIVHFGEAGRYADDPGRPFSGIAVVKGAEGREEVASLDCEGGRGGDLAIFSGIPDEAPEDSRERLFEPEDGPFGGYY